MTRIPLLSLEARLAFCLLGTLASSIIGCTQEGERPTPPPLVFEPDEARPGSQLGVLVTADGVSFDKCSKLGNDSFTFQLKAKTNTPTSPPLVVSSIGYLDSAETTPETLRIYLTVAEDAKVGKYVISLECDANTVLKGTFEIKEFPSELSLVLKPDQESAGVQKKPIVLQLDPPASFGFFDDNLTQVTFGNGDDVRVEEQSIIHARHAMNVVISISPTTPPGKIDVTAVKGSHVARGTFTVGEKITPHLRVEPSEIRRPLPGQGGSSVSVRNYTLTIEDLEKFLTFEVEPEDAGVEPERFTQVSFPLGSSGSAPGLQVHQVKVLDTSKLTANVSVRDYAHLGATRLRVQTGEQVAETAITVLATEGAPALRFNKNTLERGAKGQQLVITAVNFELQPPVSVECLESGCQIESFQSLENIANNKQIIVKISIDPAYDEKFVRIEVNSQDTVVRESLTVEEPTGPSISIKNDSSIERGTTDQLLTLTLKNGTFHANTVVRTLPRSGIRITSSSLNESSSELTVKLDVAADSPVGPALLRVETEGKTFEVALEITDSSDLPAIIISPSWIPEGRSTSYLHIEAKGFELDPIATDFQFDDPAIKIVEVHFDPTDPHVATIQIDISPGARSDMIVLYARSLEHVAAGTVRVIQKGNLQLVSADQNALIRGERKTITVQSPDYEFAPTIAQAPDHIGITISGIEIDPDNRHLLTLEVEADEKGPGGWVGIILTGQYQSFVVPLQILSDGDDSLTMKLKPATIKPGSHRTPLEIQVAPEMDLTDVSEVRSGAFGAYFSWPEIESSKKAKITADIGFDINPDSLGVPVIFTTTGGAAVGFLGIEPFHWQSLSADSPWYGNIAQHEFMPVLIEPGPAPSFLLTSDGREDHAQGELRLVATNGLDFENSPDSGNPEVWLLEDHNRIAVWKPSEGTEGGPLELKVKPLGHIAVDLDGDQTQKIDANPCDKPILLKGHMENAFDVDRLALAAITCRLKVAVLARTLAPHPFTTPDLWLERRSIVDVPLDDSPIYGGTDHHPDPALYADETDLDTVFAIGSQTSTTGDYLVNVRSPDLIREIGNTVTGSFIKVELDTALGASDLHLELYEVESGQLLERFSFQEIVSNSSGIIVVGSDPMSGVDVVDNVAVFPDSAPWSLSLKRGDVTKDSVQVGGSATSHGEGNPIAISEDDPEPYCGRAVGLDTNDNRTDFVCGWRREP